MIVNWLLRCRHGREHWTWPRQRGDNTVHICLDCGAELPYDRVKFGDDALLESRSDFAELSE